MYEPIRIGLRFNCYFLLCAEKCGGFKKRVLKNKKVGWIMVEKDVPILFSIKEECCGCTACYAICPRDAISMVEDEEGFEYPRIDESKCVQCYRCIEVCPIKNDGYVAL